MQIFRDIGNNEYSFTQGPAGDTGETYFTVGIKRGLKVEVIKDPQGDFLVFKDKSIAQRIQADFQKLQTNDPKFFTDSRDKAEILVVQIKTGKQGKVIIQETGWLDIVTKGGSK